MTKLPEIEEFLSEKEGFCRPDWDGIFLRLEGSVPAEEFGKAWSAVERVWVQRLQEKLGGNYRIRESDHILLLTAEDDHHADFSLEYCEGAFRKICEVFLNGKKPIGFGKHIVLMFADETDYYSYISYYYPEEGSHPMSGGLYLGDSGNHHYAMFLVEGKRQDSAIVHELTHGCVSQFPIPTWLNEALAMRMEELLSEGPFFLDRDLVKRHHDHWTAETIQQFWSGESWKLPGESFELSYNLASILWRKVEGALEATREEIMRFIESAHFKDAGEAAMQEIFDCSLSDLAGDFLGEGDWGPESESLASQLLEVGEG